MEQIMAIVAWVTANGGQIVLGLLSILGGFSILAKLTPTEADDKVVDAILKFIHSVGLTKKA